MSSQDIRAQLPDDSKRFESLDVEFKDMMKSAESTPMVIESCDDEGRELTLQGMQQGIYMLYPSTFCNQPLPVLDTKHIFCELLLKPSVGEMPESVERVLGRQKEHFPAVLLRVERLPVGYFVQWKQSSQNYASHWGFV